MPGVRFCVACRKAVKGRSDKKFCNDYCRNSYNNRQKEELPPYIRMINAILKKNRRILQDLLPKTDKPIRISGEKLRGLGFQFMYHTHVFTTVTGNVYHFCYDYGYRKLEQDWVLVVKRTEKAK